MKKIITTLVLAAFAAAPVYSAEAPKDKPKAEKKETKKAAKPAKPAKKAASKA